YGKTDFSYGLVDEYRKQHPALNIGMCRAFMATEDSVGAKGLPWKSERTYDDKVFTVTDPAMPGWYLSTEGKPACTYDRVVMVLEEWGQGQGDTKKAFAPLLLEGGITPFYLPEGSPRIALTNMDSRDGVTKEFDFVIGRRVEYTIEGNVDIWLEDFAVKPYFYHGIQWQTLPVTQVWAKQNPTILFEDKPKVQGPWCNPRTACMVDRYTQAISHNGVIPMDDPCYIESLQGKWGMPATVSYVNMLKFRLELPSYEDIV